MSSRIAGFTTIFVICAFSWFIFEVRTFAQDKTEDQSITVSVNFENRKVAPDESIVITLSRRAHSAERIAVAVGTNDVSALFLLKERSLLFQPQLLRLPEGENTLFVYLIKDTGEWESLGEFALNVGAKAETAAGLNGEDESAPASENPVLDSKPDAVPDGFEFTPNVSLNLKSRNQIRTFPEESAPERNPSTDLAGQGTFLFKVTKRDWAFTSQFDFAGATSRQEALRFGELQDKAPKIDLSSYLVELSNGRFKLNLGHISFGTNRHLINSFSSRGFAVTLPVGSQNEVSFAAANGTSIVGYGNFFGISRRKHSIVYGTFAREFFAKRPGGLRMETTFLRGSLLPLENFNQGAINDAETSNGFGLKVSGSDTRQRLRFELGFSRSKFKNAEDTDLQQGFNLTPIKPETKNAGYAEMSFDFLKGVKAWSDKELKLTGTFRYEEIAPLFRSIGAFSQADRRRNQFEISGTFGQMNFGFGNLSERDNLDEVASILKTLTRRNNLIASVPLNTFFSGEKPIRWLPAVSYNFDLTHQYGAFLPTAGLFTDPSQVPDQYSRNQSFNAQWPVSELISIGYAHSRAFQDNRQPGRETADLASASNTLTVGLKPFESLGLDFDISRERQKNFELLRVDRNFRFGTRVNWTTPFLENSTFNGGFSASIAGDRGNLTDSRNGEFDLQWTYGFSFGKRKFKKMSGQFFVRYANRYGDTIDRQFLIDTINRAQTFNAGLTLNLF